MSRSWIECSSSVPDAGLRPCRPATSRRTCPGPGCTGRRGTPRSSPGRWPGRPRGPCSRRNAGRAAQDEADLVDDARLAHESAMAVGPGEVGRQRLLAEHVPAGGDGQLDEPRGARRSTCRRRRASQPSTTSSSDAHGVAPVAAANASRRAGRGRTRRPRPTSAPEARSIFEWNVPISPAPRNPTRVVNRRPQPGGPPRAGRLRAGRRAGGAAPPATGRR